jgi:hypothetical protein
MNWTAAGHKVGEYAKAIVAFVVPILVQIGYDLVNSADPWPATVQQWGTFLLPSVLTALGVYGVANRPTVGQVDRAVDKLGPDVVMDAVERAA